jgi:hypothetical protein
MCAITRQRMAQPSVTRHRFTAATPDLVSPTAAAAFRGGFFDKVFSRFDLIGHCQRLVLGAQMRLRPLRVRPAAVSIELTAGTLDKPQQIIDLRLRSRRRCRARHAQKHKSKQQAQYSRQLPVHSSPARGSSDRSLTLSRCQPLRAGSRTYSTALPFSWVCHTKCGRLPGLNPRT